MASELMVDGNDAHDLIRFVPAQEPTCQQVLSGFRTGREQSHSMWYIFGQFVGLGFSATPLR